MALPRSRSATGLHDSDDEMAEYLRELDRLREEFKSALASQHELLVASGVGRHEKALLRIDAVEKAAHVFEENLTRVPTQLDRAIGALRELYDEKLRVLHIRIDTFHEYAAAMRLNAEKAIESAFNASEKITSNQKTAFEGQIARVETSYSREIESLKTQLSLTKDANATDIANLTGRLDRGEAGTLGARQAAEDRRAGVNTNALVMTCVGGFGLLFVTAVVGFLSLHQPAGIPPVGADTKRVDDLITQSTSMAQQMNNRLDALSARLNALTPTLPPQPLK